MGVQNDISPYITGQMIPAPTNDDGVADVNSAAVDVRSVNSCVLRHACGAATGSPSAQTVDHKLQHSVDGSTSWADLSGAAAPQLTADDTEGQVVVDLRSARPFVRVVRAVGFTAGTSPAIPCASELILGPDGEIP